MDEERRLAALRSYQVLDRPSPVELDGLTRLAASIFQAPIATVSLVDRDRQWFAGSTGLIDRQTPRSESFCARTLADRTMLVVPDATRDRRFANYPNVLGAPNIRFYAGAPLVDEDGFTLGALCVIDQEPREITSRERHALTVLAGLAVGQLSLLRNRTLLAEMGERLSQAGQREEDLVAAISHELRTPVTAIQGYLELLTDRAEFAPYASMVEPILRNSERLIQMVDHLLAGTRVVEGPQAVHSDQVDLSEIVAAAVTACAALAERVGIPVTFTASGPVPARADPARLGQAVEQLLRNAILFTPAGGRVLAVVTTAGQPDIAITDTGVGIPADELPYVYDRFYRGRHARQQAVPGVGLGLTLARGIVVAHGGEIRLTSGPGGTSARILLPA
jgi:signal transduction histidine kinase